MANIREAVELYVEDLRAAGDPIPVDPEQGTLELPTPTVAVNVTKLGRCFLPTLRRRNDGCYYILHFFHQHSTWQIQGDGVRQLAHRAINEGQHFPTDLFMELWTQGLVYHGDIPPAQEELPALEDTAGLRVRVQEFHRLLYLCQMEAAWDILWQGEPALEQFRGEVNTLHLTSWKVAGHPVVYDIPLARQSEFGGAMRLGVVHVELRGDGNTPPELKQYWFESNGQWRIVWSSWDHE